VNAVNHLRWGTDVLFHDDVVVAHGDAELARGVDCLLQDLYHRLITPLGSYEPHPNYGSEIAGYIQGDLGEHELAGLAGAVEWACEQDSRIDEARARVYLDNDEQAIVVLQVTPIGSANPFNLVFGFDLATMTLELLEVDSDG